MAGLVGQDFNLTKLTRAPKISQSTMAGSWRDYGGSCWARFNLPKLTRVPKISQSTVAGSWRDLWRVLLGKI